MSAFGMHPTFTTYDGYKAWRKSWRALYARLSASIRKEKAALKALQRADDARAAKAAKQLSAQRVMAFKAMTLLRDAKIRWQRIRDMHQQIEDQMAEFPLTIENCPSVDFHFNKGSLEFSFLPPWVLKAKGKTFYLHHVDFNSVGTTRETPEHASTKGSIRFRRCNVSLLPGGTGVVTTIQQPVGKC